MTFRVLVLAMLAVCATVLWSCAESGTSEGAEDADGLRLVATTGMVGDVVRTVAGDRASVHVLMGAGVDPHLYSATRDDVRALMDANAIFYNGLLLEGKMTDALIRAATSGKPVYALTERIDPSFLLTPEGFDGHQDPHVWMDPSAWSKTVDVVRDALVEVDPEHAEVYRANAAGLLDEIAALDTYAERVLASVPEGRRVLVTAHDAFNYFGERFGYEVVGIQGISTESEAGVRDIQRLIDLLVDRGVGAVFVESTVPDRSVRALIEGARARGHEVVIGGELFSDAMGDAGTYEGTYIGMIDHNVTTIARALGGDAPSGGMGGKLSE
ncbi:MAG: zinc ABC transporter substrate-binding protein [Phycisphaerales bacterium]